MRTLVLALCFLIALTAVAAEHPVEKVFMSGIDAFNAHNLDAFMQQFAPDIQMYTIQGWLRGTDAVRQRFAGVFQQMPNVTMSISNLEVKDVAPDVAVVTFQWRTKASPDSLESFDGAGSGVYVKRNGKWVEVLEHETYVPKGMTAPPPKPPVK